MRAGDSASYREDAGRMDSTRYLEQLTPMTSEAAYERLTVYRFAQRYVRGKIVADIGWEAVGYGSQLLAETAESVAGLTNSTEAVDLAPAAYPAPNVDYKKVDLPELPYPGDHFDVVVALGVVENLEQPQGLLREARRVLKPDGVLVVSTLDKQVHVAGRRPGMYVLEFQELLEHYFEHVCMYRQGAVAGGFVFPASGEVADASVESATPSLTNPRFGAEPPITRSLIAVCSNAAVLEQEEPYLLLDRDRRVFDECEDRAEDLELLREEIQRMQETEVQIFRDALRLRVTEIAYLRARIRRSEGEAHRLKAHIYNMQRSMTWRLFEPYRKLRARMAARRKPAPESTKESSDGRPG